MILLVATFSLFPVYTQISPKRCLYCFQFLTNLFIRLPHLLLRSLSLHQTDSYWNLNEHFLSCWLLPPFWNAFCFCFPWHPALLIFFLCPFLFHWYLLCSCFLLYPGIKCWRFSRLDPKNFCRCPAFCTSV